WLIDPDDIVVDSAMAATISAGLQTTDVSLSTTSINDAAGDITINGGITKATGTTATTLTFSADSNVYINAPITNSAGAAALNVKIKAKGDIVMNNTSITTQNGSIIFNADLEGSGYGGISMLDSQLVSNGGDIRLGGGTAGDGSGYAGSLTSVANYLGFASASQSAIVIAGNSVIDSGSGGISIRGYAQGSGTGVDFSTLLTAPEGSSSGLIGKAYNLPYSDDFTFFETAQLKSSQLGRFLNPFTSVNSTTPGADYDDNYSHLYSGYFYAPVSGVYNFKTASDDGSQLFLGNANSQLTSVRIARPQANTNDLVVDNPGFHGVAEATGSKTLEAGKFYPLVLTFFEGGGGDAITLSFQAPGMSGYTDNGAGYYFHNPSTAAGVVGNTSRGVEIAAKAGAAPVIRSTSGQVIIDGQRAGAPTNHLLDIPMSTLLGNSTGSASNVNAFGQYGVYISNVSSVGGDVITISSISGDINLKGQTNYLGSESGVQTLGALSITTSSGNISVEGTAAATGQNAVVFSGPTTLASATGSVSLLAVGELRASALTMSAGVQNSITTSGGSATVAGSFSGSGDLVKQGDGVLNLAVSNAMTGDTIVAEGALYLSSTSALAGGDIVLGSAVATPVTLGLNATQNQTVAKNIIVNQDATLLTGGSAALTLSGQISGSSNLTKTGDSTLVLAGNNTFSGELNLMGGRFDLGSANAIQNVSKIAFHGGTLGFSTANTKDYSSIFSTEAGQIFRFNTNGKNVVLASNFGSSSSLLIKEGAGRLSLNGAAANQLSDGVYALGGEIAFARNELLGTGAITLNGGALVYTGSSGWVLDQAVSVLGSGRLTSQSADGLTLNGSVSLKSTELTLQADKLSIAGNFSSNVGSLTILPYSAAQNIEINAIGNSANSLYISSADFAKINTASVINLHIGDASRTGNITVSGPTTLAGNTTFTGASFTSNSTLDSGFNKLSIFADNISLGDFISGFGNLALAPKTAGLNLEIGGTADSAIDKLVLNDALLNNIAPTFANVQFGGETTGNISTLSTLLLKAPTLIQGHSFINNSDIETDGYDLSIKADSISLNSPIYGDSSLQIAPNSKTQIVVGANGSNANTLYLDDFSLTQIDILFGKVTIGSDTVTRLTVPNNITVQNNLEVRAATILTGGLVDMGSNNLTVIADSFDVSSPITVSSTPGELFLAPFTKGREIGLGSNGGSGDAFVVDATTLAPFSGFNTRTIGNSDSGNIRVNTSVLTVGTNGDSTGLNLGNSVTLTTGKDIVFDRAVSLSGNGIINFDAEGDLTFKRNTDTNGTFSNFAGSLTVAQVAQAGQSSGFAAPNVQINRDSYNQINSLSQIHSASGHYYLNNDIASNASFSRSVLDAATVGDFSGAIEGFGHVISNVTVTNGGDQGGFLSTANGARLANFALTNYSLEGNSQTGGLVGSATNVNVNNVHIVGTVTAGGSSVGGLIGNLLVNNNAVARVNNSSVSGTFTTGNNVNAGGLVGALSLGIGASLINDNNHVLMSPSIVSQYAGGLFGRIDAESDSSLLSRNNIYSSPLLLTDGLKVTNGYAGGFAGSIILNGTAQFTVDGFSSYGNVQRFNSDLNTSFLAGFAGDVQALSGATINMNNIQIGEKNGRTVLIDTGFSGSHAGGLFGRYLGNGTTETNIGNIAINAGMQSSNYQAGLSGQLDVSGSSTLTLNAVSLGSSGLATPLVTSTGGFTGGVFGYVNLTENGSLLINNVAVDGNLTSSGNQLGGFIGYFSQTGNSNFAISNSRVGGVGNTVTITGNSNATGGIGEYSISGTASGLLTDLSVNANISGAGSYNAGLIGYLYSANSSSVKLRKIKVGGDTSLNSTSISGNYATGGLFGYFDLSSAAALEVSDVTVTSQVSGVYGVGGMAGLGNLYGGTALSLKRSRIGNPGASAFTVKSSDYYAGGLFGSIAVESDSRALIEATAVNGNIIAQDGYVGGFFGALYMSGSSSNNLEISHSRLGSKTKLASVEGSNSYVGGLVGEYYGYGDGSLSIHDVLINANVKGRSDVGGVSGYTEISDNFQFSLNRIAVGSAKSEQASITAYNGGSVGGLLGYIYLYTSAQLNIDHATVLNNISGTNNSVGGLVGNAFLSDASELQISNATVGTSVASATQIKSTQGGHTGGAIGEITLESSAVMSVSNTAVNAQVKSDAAHTGGLFGLSNFNDISSFSADELRFGAAGDVSSLVRGNQNVGGVFGSINNYAGAIVSVNNAAAFGEIASNTSNAGGVFGALAVSGSSNTSVSGISFGRANSTTDKISAYEIAGGIAGSVYMNIDNSLSGVDVQNAQVFGQVLAQNNYAGGFVGYLYTESQGTGKFTVANSSLGSSLSTTERVGVTNNSQGSSGLLTGYTYLRDGSSSAVKFANDAVSAYLVGSEFSSLSGYTYIETTSVNPNGNLTFSSINARNLNSDSELSILLNNYSGGSSTVNVSDLNIDGKFGLRILNPMTGFNQSGSLTATQGADFVLNLTSGASFATPVTTELGSTQIAGPISIASTNALNFTLNNNRATEFGAVVVDSLTVNSNGAITQTDAMSVANALNLNAGGADITLTNANNNLGNLITVSNADNTSLTSLNSSSVSSINTLGNLSLNFNGSNSVQVQGDIDINAVIRSDTACASEGEFCSGLVPGSIVVYGASSGNETRFAAVRVGANGSIACGNGTFGDPFSGVVKACFTASLPSDGGVIVVGGQTFLTGGATTNFNLLNPNNTFTGPITVDAAGRISLTGSTGLDIRSANALNLGTVSAAQDISVRTSSGDVTLNSQVASSTGDVKVVAAGNFINNVSDTQALVAGSGKNFRVYSSSPLDNQEGNLSYNFRQYNATEESTVLGTGNGFLYTLAPTLGLSTNQSLDKVYDGTRAISSTVATSLSLTGVLAGDEVTLSGNSSLSYDSANAGARTVSLASPLQIASATNNGRAVYGYSTDLSGSTFTGTISKAELSVSLKTDVVSKVYDGSAAVNSQADALLISGVVSGESVSVSSLAATYASKNVGNNVGLNVSVDNTTFAAGSNTSLDNYTLPSGSLSANIGQITPKTLTISGITASSKAYDGTGDATVSINNVQKSGLISGDVVTVQTTGTFDTKNAGTGKTVNLSSQFDGADVGNYDITPQLTTTADISKALLTISGITASSKTYDGTIDATVSLNNVQKSGLISGDVVTVQTTGTFDTKNAGTGKTVNLSSQFDGADVGNYAITPQLTTTADISKALLTISGITASSKTYDGTSDATVSLNNVQKSGLISGDVVTVQT
ncbi:MAG: YDG domain-containing protein, partial [Burkholderiales bacterium]|nr:YDG domain-containing protein [Burkholderiales bacterium]